MTDVLDMTTITPELAAAEGAKVLDHVAPDVWFNQIDIDNLNMGGPVFLPAAYDAHKKGVCGCIMAQLNWDGNVLGTGKSNDNKGDYVAGLNLLRRAEPSTLDYDTFAVLHGFDTPGVFDNHDAAYYEYKSNPDAILGEHWINNDAYYKRLDAAWTDEILKRRNNNG